MKKGYWIALIGVLVLYFVYLLNRKKKCSSCEIRKDKLMKQFGFESACRKKYNKNPYLRMQGIGEILQPVMQSKKVSFEDYVNSGMCNDLDYSLPNQPINN